MSRGTHVIARHDDEVFDIDGRRTSTHVHARQNALLEEQVRRARSVDGRLSTYNV